MNLKLQQAIVATRAGRANEAQMLLTQLLREEPDDANAWFLLSHLVDSGERQSLYLQKTLAIDPDHELAKQHLIQLQTAETVLPAQITPPEIPDLNLTEEAPVTPAASDGGPESETKAATTETAAVSAPPHAESLQEAEILRPGEPPPPAAEPEQKQPPQTDKPKRETAKVPATPEPAHQPATGKPASQKANPWLTGLLLLLIAAAAATLGYMVYLFLAG